MFVVKANSGIIAKLADGIASQRAQGSGIFQVGIFWDFRSMNYLVRSTLEGSVHSTRPWERRGAYFQQGLGGQG